MAFLETKGRFASFKMIGRGCYGEVYKVEFLRTNGKIIAIKKIIQSPMNAAELTRKKRVIVWTGEWG